MEFKDKVKAARLKAFMSQEMFAKEIGLAFSTVNRWENGLEVDYYYLRNTQGDIASIIDRNCIEVARYTYDAWGNHVVNNLTEDNIGDINPFRYRGYYFDQETGLYYLNARYYDPETGRFISQDNISYLEPEMINGLNLYAYCGNNSVMNVDRNGTSWWNPFTWDAKTWNIIGAIATVAVIAVAVAATAALAIATGGIAGAAIMFIAISTGFGTAIGGASAIANGTSITAGVLTGAFKGAATGAAVGLGIMTGGGAFSVMGGVAAFGGALGINFATGMLNYTIDNSLNNRGLNWGDALGSGSMQMLSGAAAFASGLLIGASGFYNVLGTTKMFSGQWFGNIAVGQLFKGIIYYPLNFVFSMLQRNNFSGS
ncbi:MAG: helix-turn-helix domain-containing protein [Bacilli bacterium]|jgi:RHS repeat-associated protein|nr:helix-turn-helix domain-containing protein [Bacilli bacterium]